MGAFIGYPHTTKGYRLLNLSNMQTLVSRHVTSYEDVLPLNKYSGNPYVKPLPITMPIVEEFVYEEELIVEATNEENIMNVRSTHDVTTRENVDDTTEEAEDDSRTRTDSEEVYSSNYTTSMDV